jgi:hypothetical protein
MVAVVFAPNTQIPYVADAMSMTGAALQLFPYLFSVAHFLMCRCAYSELLPYARRALASAPPDRLTETVDFYSQALIQLGNHTEAEKVGWRRSPLYNDSCHTALCILARPPDYGPQGSGRTAWERRFSPFNRTCG